MGARLQRLQVHRLQIDLDIVALRNVAGGIQRHAVHLHPQEAGDARSGAERQPVDAAGVIRGGSALRSGHSHHGGGRGGWGRDRV